MHYDKPADNPAAKGGRMFAETLRKELSQRASTYAKKNNLSFKLSKSGVVIFRADSAGSHGNFFTPTYKNILKREDWQSRLGKTHAAAVKAFSKEDGIRELDSCMSSDALLMNIFCHPRASQWKSLKTLFGVAAIEPEFGHKARVMKNGRGDRSEIDMKLEGLLVESKLTEADFQQKSAGVMESYDGFEQVFHKEMLPKSGKGYFNYQLIRNILAALEHNCRFCLICDGRRPDLVREFYLSARCVKDKELREKLSIVFWQEIAQAVGEELRVFLREKYGLVA
jgi:hypothetical protein